MRKELRSLLAAIAIFGSSHTSSLEHYANDPHLFASLAALKQLGDAGDGLHTTVPNSELRFGDKVIFVLYTSEGSGIVHEFAYAYQCENDGASCKLVAIAYGGPDHSSVLRHEFDPKTGLLTFWVGDDKVGTAIFPAHP